jgi:ankyrin repeat protein
MSPQGYLRPCVSKVYSETAGRYLLEKRDSDRETPLLSALRYDRLEVAKYLVDRGANVHVKDRQGCNTLFHAACFADKALIETLLSRGVSVDNASYIGTNCLHEVLDREFGSQEENTEVARLFIEAGVDLSSNN